jgi:hypothetical protein
VSCRGAAKLARTLAPPAANRRRPLEKRLDEVRGWLRLGDELTAFQAARWTRPRDPAVGAVSRALGAGSLAAKEAAAPGTRRVPVMPSGAPLHAPRSTPPPPARRAAELLYCIATLGGREGRRRGWRMDILLDAVKALALIGLSAAVILVLPLIFMLVFSLVAGFDNRPPRDGRDIAAEEEEE